MMASQQGIVVSFKKDDKEYDLDASVVTTETLENIFRVSWELI